MHKNVGMKAILMAGGKGTRVSSVASGVPKPMIKIHNKPVLEYQIECLRSYGFTDIIITVSHLASVITDYFGDGDRFGVHINYYYEEQPLGNAGALFKIKDQLSDDFLLLNADAIFNVDLARFVSFHKTCGGLATLFTHPNNHPYDSVLIIADKNGTVLQWLTKEDRRPEFYKNRVNGGLHIISRTLLEMIDGGRVGKTDKNGHTIKIDLDRQILKPLAGTGKMFCYDSPEYVKDMGTPERLCQVISDFETGKIQSRSLKNKQKAVFLDRDGTINKYVGFLKKPDEFVLIDGVAEAIKKINESGYLAIVVTNQPVIARGEVTCDELEMLHNKMETLLGREGAYLDGIYYCPHHPDKGFAGEIAELKFECECRKPKPGMLIKAAEDFNIDFCQSWMIGDSESDIQAGKLAGCMTALIGKGSEPFGQDICVANLKEFANMYLQ